MRRLLNLTDAELQTAVRWHYQEGERGEGYGKPRHEAADLDDGSAIRESGGQVRGGEEESGRVGSARLALIKCSACSREVSDKAATCPGCGAPLTPIPDSVRFTRKGKNRMALGLPLSSSASLSASVSNVALGWAVALAGLGVFIVGRFK